MKKMALFIAALGCVVSLHAAQSTYYSQPANPQTWQQQGQNQAMQQNPYYQQNPNMQQNPYYQQNPNMQQNPYMNQNPNMQQNPNMPQNMQNPQNPSMQQNPNMPMQQQPGQPQNWNPQGLSSDNSNDQNPNPDTMQAYNRPGYYDQDGYYQRQGQGSAPRAYYAKPDQSREGSRKSTGNDYNYPANNPPVNRYQYQPNYHQGTQHPAQYQQGNQQYQNYYYQQQ